MFTCMLGMSSAQVLLRIFRVKYFRIQRSLYDYLALSPHTGDKGIEDTRENSHSNLRDINNSLKTYVFLLLVISSML